MNASDYNAYAAMRAFGRRDNSRSGVFVVVAQPRGRGWFPLATCASMRDAGIVAAKQSMERGHWVSPMAYEAWIAYLKKQVR